MNYVVLAIILMLTVVESYGRPWLPGYGQWLPLAVTSLAVSCLILPKNWYLWLALAVGMLLDLTSVAPTGMWLMYCLLTVWILHRFQQARQRQWQAPWWYVVVLIAAIAMVSPLYGALLAQEDITLDRSLLPLMVGCGLFALAASGVSAWWLHRRQVW